MKTGTILLVGILLFGLAACTTSKDTASKAPQWKVTPGNPTYYINSVATSGDGSKVVGGTFFHSYGGTDNRGAIASPGVTDDSSTGTFGTYCYNQNGQLLWKDEFNGYEGVYWVDISTNGAYAAAGGWFSGSPNYAGFVRAYDASTGAQLLNYSTHSRVNQVVLSADGTWLVSAAETVVVFKLVNGAYKKTGEYTPPATNDTITTLDLSADGAWMVCGDYAGNIILLSNKGGLPVVWKQWALPSGSSHCVRMTPNGSAFAAGGSQGNFYLFDVASFVSSGQPTVTYQIASKGSVYGVAIADDASGFVGISNQTPGSTTGGLVYYVARSGTLNWTYTTARNPNCASLNLAQGILAVADGHPDGTPGDFYLINTADGSLRWQYTTTNMSWPIMISQNGNAVVAGSDDANIYYFTP